MKKELTLLAVGDIQFGLQEYPALPWVTPPTHDPGSDLRSWLARVAPVLQHSDFTMGNLEGEICEAIQDRLGRATWGLILRMPPPAADVLKWAGFSALSVSSNHTMDLGAEGLAQTLANLDRVGIAHAGAGPNIQEARKPAILEKDGVKVALLAYSSVFVPGTFPAGENKPGINTVGITTSYVVPDNVSYNPGGLPRVVTIPKPKDAEQMLEDVRRAKAQADIVVVSWHWGTSKYTNYRSSGIPLEVCPSLVANYQEDLGRAAIDAGADLIMGHHPQRLHGIEVYKGKLICYSLGHLIFGYNFKYNFAEESAILKGHIDPKKKGFTRFTLIPMMIPDTQVPYIVRISEAQHVITELETVSRKYGTKFQIEGEEIAIKAA